VWGVRARAPGKRDGGWGRKWQTGSGEVGAAEPHSLQSHRAWAKLHTALAVTERRDVPAKSRAASVTARPWAVASEGRELAGGNCGQGYGWSRPAKALGGRSSHLLLPEGRATGNCRMYDHPVAQAATDWSFITDSFR